MPSGLFGADTKFPWYGEGDTQEKKLEKMQSYLFMLLEELRFSLSNMGKENFNENGFREISEEIAGPVIKKYESLDLSVTSGDGNEAEIQITGDGIKSTAKKITFSGMVTFSSLEDENNYTVINGATITTGTVSAVTLYGSNFYCMLDDEKRRSGEILFCYPTKTKRVGGLRIDNDGKGDATESKNRIYLYAESGFVLKIYSDTRISIEAGDLLYLGAGTITLDGRINLNGSVYVNGTPLINGTTGGTVTE